MSQIGQYRTEPGDHTGMPPGIPYIIGNEAAERFSFYGMKTILTVFLVNYLWLMNDHPGEPMGEARATEMFHLFSGWVYFTPFLGAILADVFFGKYRVIIWLSLVYCLGHASLALMGLVGKAEAWLAVGLWLIIFGSGGIKPCVSAHVGDQFGRNNFHLLGRIFNWFYFSINLGAFVSSLLTPWLLEWYGPHWAFGVPGILMLLATVCFWAGRHQFIHVPPRGRTFFAEVTCREGLSTLAKLTVVFFVFVAMFWALFDQTGSSWVLQAEHMNRRFLGVDWLPSQIQALNPILILTFIPLFTYVIYPAIHPYFRLTHLRKIGIGLFLMAAAFALVALAQEKIDAGERPSISWQLFAYLLLTASEVMVSIVCLEFSYTQAPKSMKSFIMALFLLSVWVGNLFTAGVNHFIQVENPAHVDWGQQAPGVAERVLPGFDGVLGSDDDITVSRREGVTNFQGQMGLAGLVSQIQELISQSGSHLALPAAEGEALARAVTDPWGNPYRYTLVNQRECRLTSLGPDQIRLSPWDQGAIIRLTSPDERSGKEENSWINKWRPAEPWIESRKKELGIGAKTGSPADENEFEVRYFVGGQIRLEGSAYYWFFTRVMLAVAATFVVFVMIFYRRPYEPAAGAAAKNDVRQKNG